MPNINIVILGGNLTRAVETRYTPKGMAVAEFGLAVNRKWRSDAGELKEEVSFFDCSAFGKTGETISQYFHKGTPILIQGRLKQETWDDKQTGQKRSKIKVIVDTFNFAQDKAGGGGNGGASASDNDGGGPPPPTRRAAKPAAVAEGEPVAAGAPGTVPEGEDDVPF